MSESFKVVMTEEEPTRFAKFKGALSRIEPAYIMFAGTVVFAVATVVAKTLSECAKVAIADETTSAS